MHIEKKTILNNLFFILFIIIYLSQIGLAGEQILLNPDGTNSNQNQINEAINQAASQAEGITVFLTAGIYPVDNTIIMRSNVKLVGDPNAVIQVSSTSSQWFTGRIGVISCQESVKNIEIAGFQIDGNIKNLPKGYSDSRSDTDHDCEKLIILGGYSNDFAENIKIHDMKLYNAFSDGCYIIYSENVEVYNNIISNCQHEGIYFSVVKNGKISNNKIAGITSDCGRLDNCDTCLIEYNLFFSYGGESYGAYKHGENGLQIGDAGSSHGYNAAKTEYPTKNIEVRFNKFSDPGLKAVWYHGGENVYIHDNEFIDASELETMGVPIGDISIDNQPSLELSEKVFSSIFDILNQSFTDSGITNQTEDQINFTVQPTEIGKISGGVKIVGFKDMIIIDNKSYIPDTNSTIVKTLAISNPAYSVNGAKIDKNLDVKIENGTAYATLTVKMKYTKSKTDPLTGKKSKSTKTVEATFTDSRKAPEVLQQPEKIEGIIYQYPTYFTLEVPSNGLTKIKYEYKGNSSEHTFLVGSRNKTKEGVQFTEFSELEHWEGTLKQQADWVQIPGKINPDKLKVTAYTPYKEIEVNKFKAYNKKAPEEPIAWWFKPSLGLLGIIFFCLRRKWDLFRRT